MKKPVLWRNSEALLKIVSSKRDTVRVTRDKGYIRPGSLACELKDTGNGYIARFPGRSSTEQDKYVCVDYDEAHLLILALTPHAKALGFEPAA